MLDIGRKLVDIYIYNSNLSIIVYEKSLLLSFYYVLDIGKIGWRRKGGADVPTEEEDENATAEKRCWADDVG